ncbi:uncharacterized protein MONOS_1460 [Monocercomonoides exilis]|uniref:uncharacterized protein n=1 Tax=Monocercomonoides exilis TaxID=2049356 RepID=UPI00355A65B0|nr:hypothetical protein MONOS_1460 [Monocercomonoides exilis]|eukprot:MONOS_1460.1-p1 / transcript=MONOS_1460.1 / gene=MONOS_1460 / organism=Monocercomonoides_exilis_PA203 / gene_product=unspecified product / transcript_product=unspecified product / location=Mono_scaffold00026:45006-45354(-) / protein_length=101 / sequence_SO=supercontig / SO=protein_coding / is_pseudo=false
MSKRPSKLQNYSANQFEQSYSPHRLQNWRQPFEKEGIEPGKTFERVKPAKPDGTPDFICDDRGHLFADKKPKTRSMERTAFVKAPETGTVGFNFTAVGYT